MVYILGVGFAAPETVLTNEQLQQFGADLSPEGVKESYGIVERRTSLPISYFKEGNSGSARKAFAVATEIATDLGARAVEAALHNALISKEKIGLIVGDTATPTQITPSEAQRVSGRLGMKVPAYDQTVGTGAFISHLETFCSFKPERLPEYVVSFSANTPTHSVRLAAGPTAALFGDGASACVVSAVHKGKLKVISSFVKTNPSDAALMKLDLYDALEVPPRFIEDYVRPRTRAALEMLLGEHPGSAPESYFIGPQCDGAGSKKIGVEFGFQANRILSIGETSGDMLGASVGATLAACWDTLEKGRKIFVAQSGIALMAGGLILEVIE